MAGFTVHIWNRSRYIIVHRNSVSGLKNLKVENQNKRSYALRGIVLIEETIINLFMIINYTTLEELS